jgi:hypothetical protein
MRLLGVGTMLGHAMFFRVNLLDDTFKVMSYHILRTPFAMMGEELI